MTAILPTTPDDRPGLRATLLAVLAEAAAAVRELPGREAGRPGHLPGDAAKVLTESLDLAARATWAAGEDAEVGVACAELVDAVRPQVQTAALATALRRAPQLALAEGGSAQMYLRLMGRPEPTLDALVERAWQWPVVQHAERLPSKSLRLQWLARKAGFRVDQGRWAATLDASILAAETHPLFATRRDAYLLTHAAWYATDFGQDLRAVAGLASTVEPWVVDGLSWCVDEAMYDLGIELLMVGTCLGTGFAAPARSMWALLREAGARGPLPLSENARTELDGLDATGVFWRTYHPNLLVGKLCALLLQHGSAAAAPRARIDDVPPRWGEALRAAERHVASSVWQPPEEQVRAVLEGADRRDPWALDTVLLRAGRRYDVAGVLVLVSLLLDLPTPGTVARAAVDLICRAQLPDGSMPALRGRAGVVDGETATAALTSILGRVLACAAAAR